MFRAITDGDGDVVPRRFHRFCRGFRYGPLESSIHLLSQRATEGSDAGLHGLLKILENY